VLRSIHFWLGVIISLVLVALFLRAIHPSEIADAFGEANYWYIFPAIGVLFVALALRCLRWSILMRPIAPIPPQRLFSYAIIGYMANNLLPARAGEVVRAYVLGEREKVSRLGTLGTIAVERLFDGIALVALLLVAGAFVGFGDDRLTAIAIASFSLFAVALAVFFYVTHTESRARRFFRWFTRFLPARLEHRTEELIDSLVISLRSVHNPRTIAQVLGLSVIAWTIEAGAYAIIGVGFDLGVSFGHYCLLLAAANLAIIIPTFLGGTGPFEWAATLVLVGAGVPDGLAGAYSIVAHGAIFIPTTILGLIFLWSFGISMNRMTRIASSSEAESPAAT
jgi:hypothetical protein